MGTSCNLPRDTWIRALSSCVERLVEYEGAHPKSVKDLRMFLLLWWSEYSYDVIIKHMKFPSREALEQYIWRLRRDGFDLPRRATGPEPK
jgi:hypothetical protein